MTKKRKQPVYFEEPGDYTEEIPVVKEPAPKKNKKNSKKKKKPVSAKLLWVFALLTVVVFTEIFCFMPMFPMKWKLAVAGVMAVLMGILGYFSFTAKRKNMAIRYGNAVLAAVMVIGSVLMPYYKARVSKIIEDNQISSGTVRVNVYVMSDLYKEKHPEIEWKNIEIAEDATDVEKLQAYAENDSLFLISSMSDRIYLSQAEEKLQGAVGDYLFEDKETLVEAAEDLYSGKGQAMLMTESVAYMIRDMEEYKEWEDDVKILCTIYVDEVEQEVEIKDTELTSAPFSVFFGGNDQTGELNLTGRTDVDMIVTVNPVTHQIVISTFPRDCYIPNPALGYGRDKLTHLGMSGINNTLQGLSDILDTNVDKYILINFTTYMKIIDALGGVDVENPYEFTYTWDHSYVYPEGKCHLDGQAALYYVRERYSLPDGDFGRNMHQQLVMEAIIRKVSSPAIITNFNALLDALEGTFLTNLSDSSIYGFCQYQLQENISWNVITNRVIGGGGPAVCASAPSQELYVVYPYANQVQFMADTIAKCVNGEILTQEDMPEGAGYLYDPVRLPESQRTEVPAETPAVPEATPEPTPVPEATPEPTPVPTPVPEATPEPTPIPETPAAPEAPAAEEQG